MKIYVISVQGTNKKMIVQTMPVLTSHPIVAPAPRSQPTPDPHATTVHTVNTLHPHGLYQPALSPRPKGSHCEQILSPYVCFLFVWMRAAIAMCYFIRVATNAFVMNVSKSLRVVICRGKIAKVFPIFD